MSKLKNILSYLEENSLTYTDDGDNLVLDICPFCEKENKLNIKKTNGIWICWSTNCPSRADDTEHKDFESFKRLIKGDVDEVIDVINEDLQKLLDRVDEHPEVVEYFKTRNISRETMDSCNIGVNARGDIVFPHIVDGEIVRLKVRNIHYTDQLSEYNDKLELNTKAELKKEGIIKPTKWYGRGKDTLVNEEALDRLTVVEGSQIILFEGMIDHLTAHEMGIRDYVATPSASFKQDGWIDKLANIDTVILCLDNDPAGQTYARDMAERIGLGKCFNIKLPCNDLNDLWVGYENPLEVFNELIENAEQFKVEFLAESKDFESDIMRRRALRDEDGMIGFRSGYDNLDRALGGWRTSETTLFAGLPKRGKTTFLKLLAYSIASKGTATYYMSFETKVPQLIEDLVSFQAESPAEDMDSIEFGVELSKLDSVPLYWHVQKGQKRLKCIEDLEELFTQIKQRYGIKFIILDNLSRITKVVGSPYRKPQENQESVIADIDGISKRLDMHILVVHHIKKDIFDADKLAKLTSLTMESIKGSVDLSYTVDNIMLFHRKKSPDLGKNITLKANINVDGVRDVGEGGVVNLKFNEELKYYDEI